MDYDSIKEASERALAIEEWIESLKEDDSNAWVRCSFLNRTIFFDSDTAKEQFIKSLETELKHLDSYIKELAKG